MIIKFLRIQNFRCFRGIHELNLMPCYPDRSITLVGGDNGRGKTSILNAIKLCLYGKRCSSLWEQGQSNYRQFVVQNFNNSAFADGDRELKVELGLMVWENKIERELLIRRSYYLTDSRLFLNDSQEQVEVLRDGRAPNLTQSERGGGLEDQYDELLRLLIPPNFAQFYFFDGEHVREVFRRPDAANISQAVRDLLGLSFFEKLLEDLRQYRHSKLPSIYGKHQQKMAALLQKQGERDQLLGRIRALEAQKDDYEEQLSELQETLETKERDFARLGGCSRPSSSLSRNRSVRRNSSTNG